MEQFNHYAGHEIIVCGETDSQSTSSGSQFGDLIRYIMDQISGRTLHVCFSGLYSQITLHDCCGAYNFHHTWSKTEVYHVFALGVVWVTCNSIVCWGSCREILYHICNLWAKVNYAIISTYQEAKCIRHDKARKKRFQWQTGQSSSPLLSLGFITAKVEYLLDDSCVVRKIP